MTCPPSNLPRRFVTAGSTTSDISDRDALIGFPLRAASPVLRTLLFVFAIPSSGRLRILACQYLPLYYLLAMTAPKKSRREVLEAFVAEKPDDAFSRYGLALEFMNSGDVANAEAQFRELLQRNPTYVPGYQMLGQLLAKQSRTEDARAILTAGISAAAKARNGHAQAEMEGFLAEL